MKTLLLFSLLLFSLNAKEITPVKIFESTGFVNDFVINEDRLYAGNDAGIVDVFDIKTAKIIEQITLPPLTSSMNRIIPADILSVDYINNKLLILSVGNDSYRNVWIYENYMLKKIVGEEKKLTIKEARFVNDEQIIFATLGSDIILYVISEQYSLYNRHVSHSAMGDITLNKDKKKMIMADESGTVKILDIQSSDIDKSYSSQNVDNIYKVAYANGTVITAGQDRRVGVYQNGRKPYYIKSDFLVFCVGISPSGKTAVYSNGEKNDLQLFDPETKERYGRLVGHKSVVNQIKFINEKELFSSSRDNYIFYWRIN